MQEYSKVPHKSSADSLVEVDLKRQDSYYFTTSTLKLVLMSICTFGIYELYWFYKNWVKIGERSDQEISPFWRAFFALIFAYSCFRYINTDIEEGAVTEPLPVRWFAIAYVVLYAMYLLPDPYWLISLFSFVFLIPINKAAHAVNRKKNPEFNNNGKFTVLNWVVVVFGGILFFFAVLPQDILIHMFMLIH